MVGADFSDPRLAGVYDALHPDRSDLDVYADLAESLRAATVLDVGCGTGTLACLLAGRGVRVIAADPAGAPLEAARRKPRADRVRWLRVDAASLPPVGADMATMTGNVAGLLRTDEQWAAALRGVRGALAPEGRLVLASGDPGAEAWREWTRDQTHRRVDIRGVGTVETWTEVTRVEDGLVSLRATFVFGDGAALTSESTLRFRGREELADSLAASGLVVEEVRDATGQPGGELVAVARRAA